MRVRFWGTRGSLAKPGPSTLRYGGNTACVEARAADGSLIILDCGTGAHELGQALMASGEKPIRGHLLITHTHWDHIQGFPFFAPLFVPGNEWDIYAPGGLGQHLEQTLAGQMEYTYFPVRLGQLGATIRFHDLVEGTFQVGGVTVTARYLNHPAVVLGYRLEADGVTVVYATDHEPHGELAQPEGGSPRPVHDEDRRHLEFVRGADLLIHDAQYTAAEYDATPFGKRGWGHTAIDQAIDLAALASVERLALFHHDPLRSDDALDKLVVEGRARPLALQSRLEVFGAAEGMALELSGGERPHAASTENGQTAALNLSEDGVVHTETVLIADDDGDILALLAEVLEPEGLHVLLAADGEAALQLARTARPSILLLDWQMPGRDGLDVLRELRGSDDVALQRMPVLMLTARSGSEDTAAGFEAGATDYITKPFAPAHVRSRVREWLLRTRQTRIAASKTD